MLKLKNIKIIVLSIIFTLFISISSCYAVELDLSDDLLESSSSVNSTNSGNTTNENSSNTNLNTNSTNNTNISNENYNTNTSFTNSTPSATVTNSLPESDLGLSNILNIFLIVIGVLLILLSIAILIRLKK